MLGRECHRLHYLSIPPSAAEAVVKTLDKADLVERSRIIMEKPFGTDLASAKALNDAVHGVFFPEQVFRIDHFLGKEAAQNILAFRFANGLFEPIWNRGHIDHVQIDVPETLSVDTRAGFYEGTGAFRDMVVTHLFQVLAFMAMEPPTSLDPRSISEEKNKVFRSMKPIDVSQVVRGQYEGYRSIPGGGRRLPDRDVHRPPLRDRQLAVGRRALLPAHRQEHGRGCPDHLHRLPRAPEEHVPGRLGHRGPRPGPPHLRPGRLLQAVPLLLRQASRPGHAAGQAEPPVRPARRRASDVDVLEAYERLIHDAMSGDHTLFTAAEDIERLWELSTPLLEHPPRGRALPPGIVGPAEHPRPDRPQRLAAALRARLAQGGLRARTERSPHPGGAQSAADRSSITRQQYQATRLR